MFVQNSEMQAHARLVLAQRLKYIIIVKVSYCLLVCYLVLGGAIYLPHVNGEVVFAIPISNRNWNIGQLN